MTHGLMIVGGGGQLGRSLAARAEADGDRATAFDRAALDVTDRKAVHAAVEALRPTVILNASAWTAVDRAQHAVGPAFAVNAVGPAHLAEAAAATGAAIVHVSTDSVFDGRKSGPYVESDATGPVNVYGASKLAGELAVRLGAPRSVVVRTSWLIGGGRGNFLSAILGQADAGSPLSVVDDQRGTPTGVEDLAAAILVVARRLAADAAAPVGVYHFAGQGSATRHGLAVEILAAASRIGGRAMPPVGIARGSRRSGDAPRPANACLDSSAIARDYGVVAGDWRAVVRQAVARALREGKR